MPEIFVQALYTVLPALVYALSGYMSATPEENFDPKLFAKTLVIGVSVGILEFQLGVTYEQAFQMLSSNAMFTYLIDKFVNAIGKLQDKMQFIQANLTPTQQLMIQKTVQIAVSAAVDARFPDKAPVPAATHA